MIRIPHLVEKHVTNNIIRDSTWALTHEGLEMAMELSNLVISITPPPDELHSLVEFGLSHVALGLELIQSQIHYLSATDVFVRFSSLILLVLELSQNNARKNTEFLIICILRGLQNGRKISCQGVVKLAKSRISMALKLIKRLPVDLTDPLDLLAIAVRRGIDKIGA